MYELKSESKKNMAHAQNINFLENLTKTVSNYK